MSIKSNLDIINKSITEAALKCGRDPKEIELLAVSKTKPLEYLVEAYEAGQRIFGENRVQEAEIKAPAMPEDAKFYLIGHLQSNKVKKACLYFSCIQSVDSLKIAKKIDAASKELNKVMDVYLDINIVDDENKSGFIVNDSFYDQIEEIIKLENICIKGLMCIGAHVTDPIVIKKSFRDLKKLSLELQSKFSGTIGDKLSIGMSGDYELAIEEGSTMVRVGSAIFGHRN